MRRSCNQQTFQLGLYYIIQFFSITVRNFEHLKLFVLTSSSSREENGQYHEVTNGHFQNFRIFACIFNSFYIGLRLKESIDTNKISS